VECTLLVESTRGVTAARGDEYSPRRSAADLRGTVSATLYVVATPLGNLGDISERAVQVLKTVAVVAAEDTRRTRRLLDRVGSHPTVMSYHAHSTAGRIAQLEAALKQGKDVALLTDAGTPAISDPGGEFVARAREIGAHVVPIPGPSAVSAALSVAGLPADRYTFLGFLPRKGAERRKLIDSIASSSWTVVVFEAANRLVRLLQELSASCGDDRPGVVARELTKIHEEIKSGNLADLAVYYDENPPRGEVTVMIAGGNVSRADFDERVARDLARQLLGKGMTRRDVAGRVAEELAMSRRDAYKLVTEL
jgi:16S rRNA (cytidine1402-2'-O)-methyltransferase